MTVRTRRWIIIHSLRRLVDAFEYEPLFPESEKAKAYAQAQEVLRQIDKEESIR